MIPCDPSTAPLAGIRVIELARVLAGPWCGQLLADAGAEVIKVEPPTGDETRLWGPPYLPGCEPRDGWPGDSAYFACCNRNKRSIAVDLKSSRGQQVARRLIATADVVIENFRPGTLEAMNLGYEQLKPSNERLVFVSITGFGKDGPDGRLPGYDFIMQSLAGLMSITGDVDGSPTKVGVAVSDLATGVTAAFAATAALTGRVASGRGARVDVSLLETQLSWLANIASNYLISAEPARRYGNAHPNVVPYELFETADRTLVLAVGNDSQFARFAERVGHPEWARDPRFTTNAARVRHREILVPMIKRLLCARPAFEWLDAFRSVGVPASVVHSVEEAIEAPQVKHNQMIVELEHPRAGPQRFMRSPLKFDDLLGASPTSPPMFSQHALEILAELKYGAEEIEQLLGCDAVVAPTAPPRQRNQAVAG